MNGPPKIDDFSFNVPDADVVAENKAYLVAVKKAIMDLRKTVLIKGTLAAALMELHGIVNNTDLAAAKFVHYAHARYYDKDVTCRFRTRNCCLLFNVVLLIGHYQEYTGPTPVPSDKVLLDRQLKIINTITKDGLKPYSVKGDEREGYKLVRRKSGN
jgi:hypothetical protein